MVACGGDSKVDAGPDADSSQATKSTGLDAGELIAFERLAGEESRDLYTVDRAGGEPQLLRSPGEYPHWSPDGSQLAFLACLNPPDCTTAIALLERSTGEVHGFPMPDPDLETPCAVWTPSGEELACGALSEDHPSRNGVYTLRASDGQGLTRITKNPGGEDGPLAFSPDGTQLLFNRVTPAQRSALFITMVSGGTPRRITPWGYTDDYADWSPDGRTIVFGTGGSIYRVNPDGHGLRKIPLQMPDGSEAGTAFDASFSPDGQTIVFSLASPAPGIYEAQLDGSHMKRLTTDDDHHANWGPASGT